MYLNQLSQINGVLQQHEMTPQLKHEKAKQTAELKNALFSLKKQILDSQRSLFEAHLDHLDERSRNYQQWRSEAVKIQTELRQKIEHIEQQIESKNTLAETNRQQHTEELAMFKKQM